MDPSPANDNDEAGELKGAWLYFEEQMSHLDDKTLELMRVSYWYGAAIALCVIHEEGA